MNAVREVLDIHSLASALFFEPLNRSETMFKLRTQFCQDIILGFETGCGEQLAGRVKFFGHLALVISDKGQVSRLALRLILDVGF